MTPVSFRRALGLGFSGAFAHAAPALLVGLGALASTLCTSLLWLQGFSALVDGSANSRLVGLALATLAAWLLEAAVLGAAVRQAAFALRGQTAPPLLSALTSAAPRALGWAILTAAALLAWTGWQLLVATSGALLFLRGLLHGGGGGLGGALGLALVATVGPLGALFLQLAVETALVRSVVRDESASVALYEGARAVLARPFVYIGLLALTALLAATVSGSATALSSMGAPTSVRLLRGTAFLQLAIASLASAVALLVRLDAFVALELGRTDELPPLPVPPRPVVPRAELILDAAPILEARAVGPESGGG
jgi:hypothetical protein